MSKNVITIRRRKMTLTAGLPGLLPRLGIKRLGVLTLLGVLLLPATLRGAERQSINHRLPASLAKLQPVGRLAPSEQMRLVIALPLRNRSEFEILLQHINDPASSDYHRYLTPEQFADRFSPPEQDYRAVMDFATKQGLTVIGTHPNRTLVDVRGAVADIERTFQVGLRRYPHPSEPRTFFAPDSTPSVELEVPILEIRGLDDYVLPRPMYRHIPIPLSRPGLAKPSIGSGPAGVYMGKDFRAAYVPGVTLTGLGQSVGLFELDGYYANDPIQYASQAGLTNVMPPINVLVDGFDGSPGVNNVEVALDIEMVMSMAPEAQVIVYEGFYETPTIVIDLLNRMATDNRASVLSSSWTFHAGPAMEQVFQQMVAQGQSFFNSSGDYGAYTGTVPTSADDPNVTVVGGTFLTTSGPEGNWVSEVAWNRGNGEGSGGGTSTARTIPSWQASVNMSTNHGSTTLRNNPDVSMVADAVYAVADNGVSQYVGGTSISAPLWAGFAALVNERATFQGKPVIGFINPALYAIGQGTNYSTSFHDIISGSNTNSSSPTDYFAVPGYDLCTGWGSPTTSLIDALLNVQFVLPTGWTRTPLVSQSWASVASSADGMKLAAVDLGGGNQINVSSSGGATWRASGPRASWRGVASSADGVRVAAAAFYSPIYVSTDSGSTWTATTAPSYSWRSMASSADGSKLAAGAYWEAVFEVSTNSGASWYSAPAMQGSGWVPVAWSADGHVLIAGGGSGVYVSTDSGLTATTTTLTGPSIVGVAASADGSTLVAVGNSLICVSTNLGANWSVTSAPSLDWFSVACSADGYRIVAAVISGNIWLSDDRGATWVDIGPRPATWYSIACSADGTRLIVCADNYLDGPVYTGVFPRSGPVITTPPANQSAVVGSNAVFTVSALGPPPLSYQWSCNGTNIAGATVDSLLLTNVQPSDAGNYRVRVSDAFGFRDSPLATLTVIPPPPVIIVQPTNQTAVLGTTVRFSATASGSPPLSYQWMLNGGNIAGASSNILTIVNAQPGDAGTYAVKVANGYGSITSSNAVLSLISPTPCLEPPSGLLGWWPAETTAADRTGTNSGTLVGNATYGPGYVAQCFVLDGNGSAVSLANRPDLQLQALTVDLWVKRGSATLSSHSGNSGFLFTLGGSGLGLFDGGDLFWRYSGFVYGAAGVITDTNWHNVAATATTTGASIYIDGISVGGSGAPQSFSFSDAAIGALGASASNGFYGAIDEVALFNRLLSPAEIQSIYNAGHDGMCWMPAPPCIVTQPSSQSVTAGSSVNMAVTIAGWLDSAHYQWLFNGTEMTGMTNSSLSLTNVHWSQAGSYVVVVSNVYGLAMSDSATLIVQETNRPVFNSIVVLSNGTVQGQITGNAGPTCIEASTNLVDWVTLTNGVVDEVGLPFVDSTATNYPLRFYRARLR